MKKFEHLLCIGSLLFSVSVYAGKRKRDEKENVDARSHSYIDSSLFTAIRLGSIDDVQNLLHTGSKANSVNRDSKSALSFAFDWYLHYETINDPISEDFLSIIGLLLGYHANITDLNYDSILLLVQEASLYKKDWIVHLILKNLPNNLLEREFFLPEGSDETYVLILSKILNSEREKRSKESLASSKSSSEDKGKEEEKGEIEPVSELEHFENSTHRGESEHSILSSHQNVMPIRSQWTLGQSNEK